MLRYAKEFLGQRLILFLLAVIFLSGYGTAVTFGNVWTAAAILAGAVFIIIVEYTVHRYILHEYPRIVPIAYKGHVAHHQDPTNVKFLFGPVSVDMGSYVIILLAALLLTGYNWHLSLSAVFGASLFQMYYQWKHYISHRPIVPLTPWGKWMKKRHLLHHYMDEKTWYGVSNPLLDMVLHTDGSDGSAGGKKNASEATSDRN
ncbi:sterol desaturase family protein [Paenibacillus thalictri]|uniref:Fatty acid hydroxylase family protein n=1 Tax=Paenibacillus thalictri TaxID=2527873 RepID=A0A4Q9DNY6_9BACL|nr:sterol desaturase family protein [Paenibacillus thalictri]TBL74621.1 fatty acid hydroxylase family protein [Paenibacillus thalictri]